MSEPEEIRIEIDSGDVTESVLITSDFFLLVPDPECPQCEERVNFVEVDTVTINLPYDRTFPFTPRFQYFVESFPAIAEEVELSMRITIDGREWMDDSRPLLPVDENGNPETLRFIYQWSEPTLR